jgi:hypothetical protein
MSWLRYGALYAPRTSGTTLVMRDSGADAEILAGTRRYGAASLATLASQRTALAPVSEIVAGVARNGEPAFEAGATLGRDAGATAELLGALAREARTLVEALGATSVSADVAAALEWSGATVLLNATRLALALARSFVAEAAARRRLAAAQARLRVVTIPQRLTSMAQAKDLMPPIDAGEEETVGFDFGPILSSGVTITGTPTVTCAAYRGSDAAASSRFVGSAEIVASSKTGAPSAQVNQLVGTMVGGVTYRLQCVVDTSDGQTLSLWAHLACIAPD